MMKKISVILTTYNSEKYIRRTIASILGQDDINRSFEIELIVVDDCSTDSTTFILEEMQIPWLSTPENSGGPNEGRNIGLRAATGDLICIADHDDEWMPHRITTLLPYTEKATIITSGYTLIDTSTGKESMRSCPEAEKTRFFEKNKTFRFKLAKSQLGQNTYLGSMIYSASLKDILFEEKYGAVDFDWIIRLFHHQPSIEVCASLYNRYVDGTNLSLDEDYRIHDYNFSLDFIRQYEKDYPGETRLSRQRINGTMARYYYIMDDMKKARYYFRKSEMRLKTIIYYLTTWYGSHFVKKYFNVFV